MADETRSRTWLWVVIGGGAFFLFLLAVFTLVWVAGTANRQDGGFSGFGSKIGVVDLDGVIVDSSTVVRELKDFADDDSIKAIVIHMDTPGGGVAASQEIYQTVKRIREQKKKRIVASISDVGASGGYYVASATDKIYADPGSIVGSIGVIADWTNYGDLLRWAKLKPEVIKAGEYKDTGSPTREMTPEERAYLQSLVDNMHTQFIQAVADGRHLKVDDVKAIADGKVWTGQQALPMKLVDQLADFSTAVEDTAKAVGITGEPSLVYPPKKRRRTLLDVIFGDWSEYLPDRARLLQQNPGFYYLWR